MCWNRRTSSALYLVVSVEVGIGFIINNSFYKCIGWYLLLHLTVTETIRTMRTIVMATTIMMPTSGTLLLDQEDRNIYCQEAKRLYQLKQIITFAKILNNIETIQ